MKILTKRQAKAMNFKGRNLRSLSESPLLKKQFFDKACIAISYDESRDEVRAGIPRGWGGGSSIDTVVFDREALLVTK